MVRGAERDGIEWWVICQRCVRDMMLMFMAVRKNHENNYRREVAGGCLPGKLRTQAELKYAPD